MSSQRLDTKQQVLIAMYTEYQKDIPQMGSVTANSLGIDHTAFYVAIEKLQNEEFITDAIIVKGGPDPYPLLVRIDEAKLTRIGIEHVESKLEITDTDPGLTKVQSISRKVADWGLDKLLDYAAKVTVEMMK